MVLNASGKSSRYYAEPDAHLMHQTELTKESWSGDDNVRSTDDIEHGKNPHRIPRSPLLEHEWDMRRGAVVASEAAQ